MKDEEEKKTEKNIAEDIVEEAKETEVKKKKSIFKKFGDWRRDHEALCAGIGIGVTALALAGVYYAGTKVSAYEESKIPENDIPEIEQKDPEILALEDSEANDNSVESETTDKVVTF